MSLYSYVRGAPISGKDPSGLESPWGPVAELIKELVERLQEYNEDSPKRAFEEALQNAESDPETIEVVVHPVPNTLTRALEVGAIKNGTPCENAYHFAERAAADAGIYSARVESYYSSPMVPGLGWAGVSWADLGNFIDHRQPRFAETRDGILQDLQKVTQWITQDVCCCRNSPYKVLIKEAIGRYNSQSWQSTPMQLRLPQYSHLHVWMAIEWVAGVFIGR